MVVRGPRAWLILAASSLVIGAMFAVLSAWAGAAFGRFDTSTFYSDPVVSPSFQVAAPHGWKVRAWIIQHGAGIDHHLVSECEWKGSQLSMEVGPDAPAQRTMLRVLTGWPLPCMAYSLPDDTNAGSARTWWEFGVPLPGNRQLATGDPRRLPLRPSPIAFAATAGFWGLVMFALGGTLRIVRLRSILRRGLCPHCACPLSEGKCPECGFAAPASVRPLSDAP